MGQSFGPRYHIIKLLGAGGMGAVYQAWDAELGIAVAIKVIRPDVAASPEAAADLERRFKRELLLARQITHTNVVRIHDLGEIDGIKYITMPFIPGQDLATILRQRGTLPVSVALRLGRQIAAGLQAAHEAGVVHRDLKPANIMVEGEHVTVMDFGIARSTADGGTKLGAVMGTIEYMAPEQASGERVDHRADIYAVGLILSDLLVGRPRASHPEGAVADLMDRMQRAPRALRTVAPEIPEAVDRIVTRCLQPDPAARYQTTAALVADLDALDPEGHPIPGKTLATRPRAGRWTVPAISGLQVTAGAAILAGLIGIAYWFAGQSATPAAHEPVSVVIADLENLTGDPAFDQSLEPVLKLAVEGASFVSAYDRSAVGRTLGVRPPERLDARAAQEIAVKQGLGVVVTGSIARRDAGYHVAVRASQAVSGDVIATLEQRASNKDEVLGAVTDLAIRLRDALGDDTSDSGRRFAMETLSSTSLDVVRSYARAMDALSRSRFDEALRSFATAVEQDPNFGLAYAGMAIASRNLDRHHDAEKYIKEAVRHLDTMTERERYRTRGLSHYLSGDYRACVREYGDLIARFAADAAARNNLALCLSHLRELPRAVREMQQVVKILPGRALYRENLALYAAYSGDGTTAEREARALEGQRPFGLLALAFAHLLQGRPAAAMETYERLRTVDEQGASYAASGLGDLAFYQGRLTDAATAFEHGAAADLAAEAPDRAASKLAALAHVRLLLRQERQAVAAAERALAASSAAHIRFLAARVFVDANELARARSLAAGLGSELLDEPRAYARLIEGLSALESRDPRQAIKALDEANGLLDTWIGHFDLGRAYLEAGLLAQADSEFDRCIRRRGEALSLFLNEEPTYGHFPLVHYYQGRVREALGSAGFAESYRTYLSIRGESTEDPLVPEIRRRLGT